MAYQILSPEDLKKYNPNEYQKTADGTAYVLKPGVASRGGTKQIQDIADVPAVGPYDPSKLGTDAAMPVDFPQNVSPFKYPDQTVLGTAMNEIRAKLSANADLTTQKAMLLKQLYNQPLTPEEIKTLSPSQALAITDNNRNMIDMELRLIGDELNNRTNTVDTSIKYITDQYNQAKTDAETQFKDAQGTVLQFIQQYGSNAKAALTALYGPDKIQQLKNMGLDIDKMASLATLGETKESLTYNLGLQKATLQYGQAGGTGTAFDVSIPSNTLAGQNNNPGNLVFAGQTGATQGAGGFAKFLTPQEGFQALVDDLAYKMSGQSTNPIPDGPNAGQVLGANSTLQDLIRVYAPTADSNDPVGYAQKVASAMGITPQAPLGKIDATDLAVQMANHESGTTVTKVAGQYVTPLPPDASNADIVDPALGITPNSVYQSAIDYALTGKMPSLGLGSASQTKNTRFAIQSKAGAITTAAGTTIPQLQAEYKANQAALTKMLPIYSQTSVNEQNAIKNFNLLIGLAKKMDANTFQTAVPAINSWLRTNQIKLTGDSNVNNFISALIPTLTEYAKVVTGQTGGAAVTDSARSEMQTILNSGLNADTIESFVNNVAVPDMNNRTGSYIDQINTISGTIGNFLQTVTGYKYSGSPAITSPTTSAAAPTSTGPGATSSDASSILNKYGITSPTASAPSSMNWSNPFSALYTGAKNLIKKIF